MGFPKELLEAVLALAMLGGVASTRQLVDATGSVTLTTVRCLRQLERHGYVHRTDHMWRLDLVRLRADILALVNAVSLPASI